MAPTPSPMTLKRIHKEMTDLQKEDLGQIKLTVPNPDNPFLWKATIPGPEGSVYEGGQFDAEVSLASDYPFSAPKVNLKTKIYHMNIAESGAICIDILKYNWSPALSVFKVILSLSSLLTDPNPSDPLVPQIAAQYKRSRAQHDKTARQWTKMYAMPEPQQPPPPPSSSTKGKGRTTRSSNERNPIIVIPDDPPSSSSSASRPPPSRKRKAPSQTIPVDDDDDDPLVIAPPRTRQRRTRATAATTTTDTNSASGTTTANGATPARVIVIDD